MVFNAKLKKKKYYQLLRRIDQDETARIETNIKRSSAWSCRWRNIPQGAEIELWSTVQKR